MIFRVGQKVVCVNAKPISAWGAGCALIERRTYTIREVGPTVTGAPGVRLREVRLTSAPGYVGWHSGKPFVDRFYRADRFRPAVERSTDIGMAILKKVAADQSAKRVLVIAND